jgi:hypothetical protein
MDDFQKQLQRLKRNPVFDADHAQTSREISFRGAVGNVPDIE